MQWPITMANEISRNFPTDFSSRISAVLWPTMFCSCNHWAATKLIRRRRPAIPSTALPTHKSSDCLPHRLLSCSRDGSLCVFNFTHGEASIYEPFILTVHDNVFKDDNKCRKYALKWDPHWGKWDLF